MIPGRDFIFDKIFMLKSMSSKQVESGITNGLLQRVEFDVTSHCLVGFVLLELRSSTATMKDRLDFNVPNEGVST